MRAVLAQRDVIGAAAHAHAPFRRYWAVVGNGPNRIAAHEVRIKLSELCYKSIACDGTEDKKHIDLSSEPMILVCAAGLSGSNADDVAKELAIYRAHKAAAIAIVSEDDDRYGAAVEVIRVPARPRRASGSCSARWSGHLFGYEAALAIDASARPLREARAAVEATPVTTELAPLAERLAEPAAQFFTGVRTGLYDGALEAATAVRLASVLRYAAGIVPLDVYSAEHGTLGTPAVVAADLTVELTKAIEELTRPVDAIKHQAKTVTVGISRADETLLQVPLVRAVLDAGGPRDGLTYKVLRTLVDLDPAVVRGHRVDPLPHRGRSRVGDRDDRPDRPRRHRTVDALARRVGPAPARHEADGGGGAPGLRDPRPRRRPHRRDRARGEGRADRGPHAAAPRAARPTPARRRPRACSRATATATRRCAAPITETEPELDDARLADVPVVDLLTLPIASLADRWRR